jgi:hypothetical protein
MPRAPKARSRRRTGIIVAGNMLVEIAGLWFRARRLGGNVVVRCRQGHLFTTIWIPGASIKSLRLVAWRVQRCPVGSHWSLVTPLNESKLTKGERRFAHEHHDIRLP